MLFFFQLKHQKTLQKKSQETWFSKIVWNFQGWIFGPWEVICTDSQARRLSKKVPKVRNILRSNFLGWFFTRFRGAKPSRFHRFGMKLCQIEAQIVPHWSLGVPGADSGVKNQKNWKYESNFFQINFGGSVAWAVGLLN